MKKVYIAGPGYSEDERSTLHSLKEALIESGYNAYSPFEDGGVLPSRPNKEERRMLFDQNVDELLTSEYVVAVMDRTFASRFQVPVFDMGVSWEIGVAFAMNVYSEMISSRFALDTVPKVVVILPYAERDGMNMMLAESLYGLFSGTVDAFIEKLKASPEKLDAFNMNLDVQIDNFYY